MKSKYYYILEDKIAKPVNDVMIWAKWFEGANRIVKSDFINDVHVSTVFLGLDHSFNEGAPMIFGTMIFNGKYDDYQERYSTWEDAEIGHQKALNLVKNA